MVGENDDNNNEWKYVKKKTNEAHELVTKTTKKVKQNTKKNTQIGT